MKFFLSKFNSFKLYTERIILNTLLIKTYLVGYLLFTVGNLCWTVSEHGLPITQNAFDMFGRDLLILIIGFPTTFLIGAFLLNVLRMFTVKNHDEFIPDFILYDEADFKIAGNSFGTRVKRKIQKAVFHISGLSRLPQKELSVKDSDKVKYYKMNTPRYNSIMVKIEESRIISDLSSAYGSWLNAEKGYYKNINEIFRKGHQDVLANFYLEHALEIEKADNILGLLKIAVHEEKKAHKEKHYAKTKLKNNKKDEYKSEKVDVTKYISKEDYHKYFYTLFEKIYNLEPLPEFEDKAMKEKLDKDFNKLVESNRLEVKEKIKVLDTI